MISVSVFAQEIEEQPETLKDLIDKIPSIKMELSKIDKYHKIVFVGMGSSLYASIPSVYFLRQSGIDADYIDASEAIRYFDKKLFEQFDICVLVSQSGETTEILRILDMIKELNILMIGVTAHVKSHLGAQVDIILDIFSGEEKAMGTTKTHINSVLTLLIISLIFAKRLENELENIQKLPNALELSIHKGRRNVEKLLKYSIEFENSIITTTGFALGEVYQAALTLNEIARVNVFPISTGMFKHGPIELFADKRSFIQFIPDVQDKNLLVDLGCNIVNRAKFSWIISNSQIDLDCGSFDKSVIFDSINSDLPEYLQGVLFLPYVQILSDEIRKIKGIEENEFYLISKVIK